MLFPYARLIVGKRNCRVLNVYRKTVFSVIPLNNKYNYILTCDNRLIMQLRLHRSVIVYYLNNIDPTGNYITKIISICDDYLRCRLHM